MESLTNVFGALRHLLYYSDRKQQLWFLVLAAVTVLLFVLHHVWKENRKLMTVWRVLCALPFLLCVVHCFLYCIVSGGEDLFDVYWLLYLVGIVNLSGIFLADKKLGYRIGAAVTGFVTVVCGGYFCLSIPPTGNFSRMGYADSFCALVDEMKEHYVLADWKGLDLDGLREEFLPRIQEAEKNKDAAAFASAVRSFIIRTNDGHVTMWTKPPEFKINTGYHEYGLATVLLGNGDVIAVCTGTEANAAGIYDGTVLTKWNGVPVKEAVERMENPYPIPVASNAEFLKTIYLSATGGETVSVSFLDENGTEKSATLSMLEETAQRVREVLQIFQGRTRRGGERQENYSTKMLTDTCGYLLVTAEETDSTFADNFAYLTGVHKPAMRFLREKLDALSAQGMTRLVIDLRGNGGGLDEISLALASLFAKEERFGIGLAVGKPGKHKCVAVHHILPEGSYSDLPVVVLTDFCCASAGDGAVLYLSKLENVTVAGITEPDGCNQETGGRCILSESGMIVMYPTGLVVDEKNQPNIDTGKDGVSRNPVKVNIPFDQEACLRILNGEGDYELEWAVEYLK